LGLVRFHFLQRATVKTSGLLGRVDFVEDIENGSTRSSNSGSRHRQNRHLDPAWGKGGFFIEIERPIVSERTMNDGRIEIHELTPLSLSEFGITQREATHLIKIISAASAGAHMQATARMTGRM
jgi:hypothetical protein